MYIFYLFTYFLTIVVRIPEDVLRKHIELARTKKPDYARQLIGVYNSLYCAPQSSEREKGHSADERNKCQSGENDNTNESVLSRFHSFRYVFDYVICNVEI